MFPARMTCAPPTHRGHLFWNLLLIAPLMLACESDSLKPAPLVDESQIYWRLELDRHTALMSTTPPYDTLTIAAIPRNAAGEPIAGLPTPQYISMDLEKVRVTPEGVVHAIATTTAQTLVVATLTTNN